MRAEWHIVAQLACVALGCGSSGEDEVTGDPQRECPVIEIGPPGSSGTYRAVPSDITVRETYRGKNGAFTDHCIGGTLVQHACDVTFIQGPPGDPGTWVYASGDVERRIVDCGGRCRSGACPDVCPAAREELRYLSIDVAGTARFESLASGNTYTCFLRGTATGADCTTAPKPGDVVNVISTNVGCFTRADFWTGTGEVAQCDYWSCEVVVP